MTQNETTENDLILSLNSIEVLYDSVVLAIKGVSIQVATGDMVALLGSNGAGKSTTLKAISGLLRAERGKVSRGDIMFDGKSIGDSLPQDRVKMGICHVIEGRRVFEHLTPDENLEAAAPMSMSRRTINSEKDRMYEYFPRLAERKSSQSGYLSGGEQQMLAIARALMPIERLHGYGFTNYLEDTPDAVRARARELANRIASGAPLSIIAAKASVRATMDLGCTAGLEEGKRLHETVYASQDAIEGPRAFAEKRPPVWQGK